MVWSCPKCHKTFRSYSAVTKCYWSHIPKSQKKSTSKGKSDKKYTYKPPKGFGKKKRRR